MPSYYATQGYSQFYVSVPPKASKKLSTRAKAQGLSRNALLCQIVSDFLDDPAPDMLPLYAGKDRVRLRFWAEGPLSKRIKTLAEKRSVTMAVVCFTAITTYLEDST